MEEKKCYIAHHWDIDKTLRLSAKEKAIIEWFLETMDFDPDGIYLEDFTSNVYEFEG